MTEIGRVIGETTLSEINFISESNPELGEYITIKHNDNNILGIIENLIVGNSAINKNITKESKVKIIKDSLKGSDYYTKGKIKILGDLNNNLQMPRTPIAPGSAINLVDKNILNDILNPKDSVKIGNLINKNINISLNTKKMTSRHLAVLAMTGAGKSNTIYILIDELLKSNNTTLIFDMHAEYVSKKFNNGDINIIEPVINPNNMAFEELKELCNISDSAFVQERFFRKAYKLVKDNNSNNLIQDIKKELEEAEEIEFFDNKDINSGDKNKIIDVLNKIEDMEIKNSDFLNYNVEQLISNIKEGYANIINLSDVDDNTAEIIISHVMRNLLSNKKKENSNINFPIFNIIEEAHIIAPKGKNNKAKYWLTRIAREGRKFGIGLCLVSQSPRSVDEAILSQCNNMIIMRITDPADQRHIQGASENLSKELLNQLSSLNIGEAIILGLMTKIPSLVKIDLYKDKGDDF